MRIVAPIAANSNRPDSFSGRRERDDRPASHRALVTTRRPEASPPVAGAGYRDAMFLAQLIAVKGQLPQTRERRRAEPDEAISLYRAANAGAPAMSGRNFSRES